MEEFEGTSIILNAKKRNRKGENDMDNETKEISTKKGIFILIWFFVGIFGMLISKAINEDFIALFVGQFLLLIPILFITGDMKRNLLNSVVTFCCLIFCAFLFFLTWLNVFASNDFRTKIEETMDKHSSLIFSLVFLFFGLGSIITHIIHIIGKKKRCTHLITATVIGLKEHNSSDSTTYSPIYQFWFNGAEYTVTGGSSRNFALPKVGSQKELHINPETPTDFYDPSIANHIFILFMGISFSYFAILIFMDYIKSI